MASREILSLDTATPQIVAPQTGDTYSAPRAVAISPESLTGSAATTSLDIAQTWNTTGTPTAVKMNVTDTASNAASLLMDLQVGGASKFNVDKTGLGSFATGVNISTGATGFTLQADSTRVSTIPVSYLRPTNTSSAMVLDLMPNTVSYATTATSGTGSVATVTFATMPSAPAAGSTVIVSGVTPTAYNGTFTVLASPAPTTTSVSYTSTATGSQTVAGNITVQPSNQANTGTCWIDVVNRDLRTVPDNTNWNVARLAVQDNGNVIVGAASGGSRVPGALSLLAGSTSSGWIFRSVGANDNTGSTVLSMLPSGQITAGTGSWFVLYPTLGVWLLDKQFTMKNSVPIVWYDSAVGQTAYDTYINRGAAGVVKVAGGSTGTAGGAIQYNAYTYATLPTGVAGMVAYISDASNASAAWGDNVTAGGGSNKYLCWYNGTNWTVIGK